MAVFSGHLASLSNNKLGINVAHTTVSNTSFFIEWYLFQLPLGEVCIHFRGQVAGALGVRSDFGMILIWKTLESPPPYIHRDRPVRRLRLGQPRGEGQGDEETADVLEILAETWFGNQHHKNASDTIRQATL